MAYDRYPPEDPDRVVEERVVRERVHEPVYHDPVVVERDSGAGMGMVLGVLVALILALALLWFAFGSNFTGGARTAPNPGSNSGPTININPPAQPAPAQPGGGSAPGGGSTAPSGGGSAPAAQP